MSKFVETEYINTKELLKFPDHYVAMAVMVSNTGVVADADGKKIVKQGTVIGGSASLAKASLDQAVVDKAVLTAWAYLLTGAYADNNGILFTAKAGGTGGNSISIAILSGGNNKTLGVTVSNNDITIQAATNGDGVITSTAKDIADAVNASATAKVLVSASYAGNEDGTDAVVAVSKTALANGVDVAVTGAEGILLYDVDVTHGPKEGAMLLHGFVDASKLPYGAIENPKVITALASVTPMIQFIV